MLATGIMREMEPSIGLSRKQLPSCLAKRKAQPFDGPNRADTVWQVI
jgi:hypothetical protein